MPKSRPSVLLLATLALYPFTSARALTAVIPVSASDMSATASSTFEARVAVSHLIDDSGLTGGRHHNDGGASDMWHSAIAPKPSSPTPGLPEFPAWVRFDFKKPQAVNTLAVWNHNQAGLTDRGFRETKVYGTTDGKSWFPIGEFTLKQASKAAEEAQILPLATGGKALTGVILAAKNNYGGNVYGLSEAHLLVTREVASGTLPLPDALEAAPQPVYRHRKDGKPGREVIVRFKGPRVYETAKLECRADGKPAEISPIAATPAGVDAVTVLLPEGVSVDKSAEVDLTLRVAGKTVGAHAVIPAKRQWTVFLYPHSHVDIGYTQSQAVVEKIVARNMRTGMEIAEYGAKIGVPYVWNPEVMWAAETFLASATPAEKEKFLAAVKAGRVGLDASFANLDTSVCADEELLHYLQSAMRMRRLTGAPVDTLVQVDVPGMSWGVPQVAAQCGIKGILDCPNGFGRVGTVHKHFQRPFWWVSPDGKSRVLYLQGPQYDLGWMWKGQYTKPNPYPHFPNPAPGWIQDWPSVGDRVRTATPSKYFIPIDYILGNTAALENEGAPHDFLTLTWSMSDNSLPDADLPDAVKDWNERYAYPKVVIASASEIIGAYIKKFGDKFPEVRGDLTEYWTDGLGSDALRVGYNRVSKEKLVQAEALRLMLDAPKSGDAAFTDAAYASWRWVLLGSEHTWGYHDPAKPVAKEVEKVKSGYFEKGKSSSDEVLAKTLALAGKSDGAFVSVFNTLSFERTGLATLPVGVAGLTDASGAPVPVQKLASGETVFLAKAVPALGSKSWKVAPASSATAPSPFTVTDTSLENDLVRVELSPETGDIAHLVDKRTGRDFVDPKSPYAINSYRYLKGGNPAAKATGATAVKIARGDRGPLVASLIVTSDAEGCKKLTREVRLVSGSDTVELLDTVDKISTRQKEGVHFGFAFNVPEGRIRMDIPWGVMTPEADQMPGANKNWLAFQRWVDVSNADSGVTWSAVEAPIIEVGDITANIMGMGEGWRTTIAPTQTIFSWALNNHWFTNFPLEQGGVIPFRYAIRPHSGYDPVAANRFGLAQNRPLLAARTDGSTAAKPPVTLDNPRVFLSTAKPADDGSGATILRLRSLSENPERVNLAFPSGAPRSLRHCGAGDEIPGDTAASALTVAPYGLVTLRLEK